MSLSNPSSPRNISPARPSTAAPKADLSGLDAFSNADGEVDWPDALSALDKFSTESDTPARRPGPPVNLTTRSTSEGPRRDYNSALALDQAFEPEARMMPFAPDVTPAPQPGARLLPVRPRAPIMDSDVTMVDPAVAALARRLRDGRPEAAEVELPAALPAPPVPLRDRLRSVTAPLGRATSTGLQRLVDLTTTRRAPSMLVGALIVFGVMELGVLGWYLVSGPTGPSGTMTVTSAPVGAQILIDGTPRGETPSTLRIPEGVHTLELRSAGLSEVLAMHVAKDSDMSRYFELASGTTPGRLHITTKPVGADVSVDGRIRGKSPLVIDGLNPGSHIVRVDRGGYSFERSVTLQPGSQTSTDFTIDSTAPKAASGHGFLTISTPISVQAFEGARLIGTTQASPWQVRSGRHEITLVNDTLGFKRQQTVNIEPGRTTALALTVPPATLSIELPQDAQLEIDGESVSTGSISSYHIEPGQHDVVVRHPSLGERRLRVTMAAGVPVSLKIDFTH